jgi:hypothetical protein
MSFNDAFDVIFDKIPIEYINLTDFDWFGLELTQYYWKVATVAAFLTMHTLCERFV